MDLENRLWRNVMSVKEVRANSFTVVICSIDPDIEIELSKAILPPWQQAILRPEMFFFMYVNFTEELSDLRFMHLVPKLKEPPTWEELLARKDDPNWAPHEKVTLVVEQKKEDHALVRVEQKPELPLLKLSRIFASWEIWEEIKEGSRLSSFINFKVTDPSLIEIENVDSEQNPVHARGLSTKDGRPAVIGWKIVRKE